MHRARELLIHRDLAPEDVHLKSLNKHSSCEEGQGVKESLMLSLQTFLQRPLPVLKSANLWFLHAVTHFCTQFPVSVCFDRVITNPEFSFIPFSFIFSLILKWEKKME